MFKQQNQCSNHEICVPFENGVWLISYDAIGQCDVLSLSRCSLDNAEQASRFLVSFTLLTLFSREFKGIGLRMQEYLNTEHVFDPLK